jgi:outer membrane phospholipase A
MSSTLCVRCGSDLIPFSYCKVCSQVVRFVCSSCNMITDERFHVYCKRISSEDNNSIQRGQEQILIKMAESRSRSRSALNNKSSYEKHQKHESYSDYLSYNRWNDHLISSFSSFIRSIYDNQDQLNEQLRYSSVNLSSSYLSTFFDHLKLINNYWMKAYTNCSRLIENKLNSV